VTDEGEPDLAAVEGDVSPSPNDPTRTARALEGPPSSTSTDHSRLPAPLQVRDRARYRILNEHGRGGLGRVLRVYDRELGRELAVKELLQRGGSSEIRFLREAMMTARLEHPGIIPIHEAGRWPDGTPFYAMKLVHGRPLSKRLEGNPSIEERFALLPHLIAIADAIAYAHDHQIIHRDLKPSNVIIGDFGETVVIDWGLAKDLTETVPELDAPMAEDGAPAARGLTVAGTVLGTPAYMAPEQARGEPVDERCDVYALGLIAIEVLSGKPARDAAHLRSMAVTDALRAVLAKATAARPEDRYPSAKLFVQDLRRSVARQAVVGPRLPVRDRLLASWQHTRRKPLRAVVAVLGVALGVAVFVAISAIHASTRAYFQENVAAIIGDAVLTMTGAEAGIDEATLEISRGVPGVKQAVPMIEARARTARGTPIVVFGIGPQDTAIHEYRGTPSSAGDIDVKHLLEGSDSIVLTRRFAADNGLAIGSSIDLVTAIGKERFVVRALLDPTGPARAYGGDIAVMDLSRAQVVFGKTGKVDRIHIVRDPGVEVAALAARLQEVVGGAIRVERGVDQVATLSGMVAGYQTLTLVLSVLAMLVVSLLAANAITVAVIDRRREIAALRALRVAGRDIVSMFVIEAACLGLVGGLVGAFLGRGLAELLVGQVSQSMSRQFAMRIDVSGLQFDTSRALLGAIAGAGVATLGALWPAWKATRVRGADLASDRSAPRVRARSLVGLRVLGLAMLVVVGVMARAGASAQRPASWVSAGLVVFGVVVTAPWLVEVVARGLAHLLALGRPLARYPLLGLGVQNSRRLATPAGRNALGLVIAIVVAYAVATAAQSFVAGVSDWRHHALRSDLWVNSNGRLMTPDVPPIAESFGDHIDRVPGVSIAEGKGARGLRVVRDVYGGRTIVLVALDRPHPSVGNAYFVVVDRPVDDAVRDLYAAQQPTVLASTAFAAHFHKKTGDLIDLETPSGRQRFRIVGTFIDHRSPVGALYMSRDLYKTLWRDPLVTEFSVELDPGFARDQVRAGIEAALGRRGLIVIPNTELPSQFHRTMEETFGALRAIEIAPMAVGALALLLTLLMSLFDRMAEFGVMRMLGMSRSQLVQLIVTEAALLAIAASVVGIALGAYIAKVWLEPLLVWWLGRIVYTRFPASLVATMLGSGLLIGIVVGLVCARQIASLGIRAALER